MQTRKYNNMIQSYTGFRGTATVADIVSRIPDTLKDWLTGKQLGVVMDAIHAAYQSCKAQAGAWASEGLIGRGDKSIPTAVYDRVSVTTEAVTRYVPGYHPVASTHYRKDGDQYVEISNETARVWAQGGREVYRQESDYVTVVRYEGREIARHNGVV